ncbi:hypothetical protein [Planobispora takensis]|uniref:Uncharacterized protein n=1 Tax=Planobispora takensis TaxID=1367882 RepID=A0A8J3WXQ3_9ACTN|nr:hypothetical protein [Planobispora takensis]GII05063.1 hypothetical protein Pta02_70710 [Planobispora takensis]
MDDAADPYTLVEELRMLPEEWLADLVREVFERRRPRDGEDGAVGDRCFLAVGDRCFLAVSSRSRDARTGTWTGEVEYTAVAHPDRDHYDDPTGTGWGFVQSGACGRCRVRLTSSHKNVRCPVCDGPAYLT